MKPVEAPSAGRCLVKFMEGEVAAVVGDETTLAGFTLQDPSSKIVGTALSPGQYGLGTQAETPEFTRFVNGVLEQLRNDGTLDQLYAKWMKPVVGGSAPGLPAADYSRTSRTGFDRNESHPGPGGPRSAGAGDPGRRPAEIP